ncbi:MAG TPA: dihydroorotate dehydrogenase electron transfer subunit [Gemmatimonadota bacterium]|nr:dihydroorotate dehydrogenase electron transfer subunit [Gemmatimonadota bacterium]
MSPAPPRHADPSGPASADPIAGRSPWPPVRHRARVLSNRRVAEATWWLELESPEIAAASRPGQFVMIGYGVDNLAPPLLPRPFSVGWRSDDGRVGLLVRTFGSGTRRMSGLEAGDETLLLGPLGRPFRLEEDRPIQCVAGGVGLAPFLFLAGEARARGREVRLLYGERTGARVFDLDLVRRLTGGPAEVWTEDGSAGRKGLVLDGIDLTEDPLLLGCGPGAMLRALADLAARRGASLQVSVEEHMGCGVGTCQGCVVPRAGGGWAKACVEGPVFDAGALDWGVP